MEYNGSLLIPNNGRSAWLNSSNVGLEHSGAVVSVLDLRPGGHLFSGSPVQHMFVVLLSKISSHSSSPNPGE